MENEDFPPAVMLNARRLLNLIVASLAIGHDMNRRLLDAVLVETLSLDGRRTPHELQTTLALPPHRRD
jgi:hypothetical protein